MSQNSLISFMVLNGENFPFFGSSSTSLIMVVSKCQSSTSLQDQEQTGQEELFETDDVFPVYLTISKATRVQFQTRKNKIVYIS